MKVKVFYPQMVVHLADCADVKREQARTAPDTTVTVSGETLDKILTAELAEGLGDLGYTVDDFDVKPCAR